MTPEQFAYWLQGFVELNGGTPPNEAQWKSIGEHLQTVFHKTTPPVSKAPLKPEPRKDWPGVVPSWPAVPAAPYTLDPSLLPVSRDLVITC